MHPRPVLVPVLLALTLLAMAACGDPVPVAVVRTPPPLPALPGPTATSAPTPAPVPTATPVATATPVEVDGDLLTPAPTTFTIQTCSGQVTGLCALKPGKHSADPFVPAFTYRLADDGGDPWVLERHWPDGGRITRGSSSLWWATGFVAGVQAYLTVPIGPGIQDVANHLRRYQGRTVGPTAPATVGGAGGIVFDLRTNDQAIPRAFLLADDGIDLTAQEFDRIYVVDRGGQRVMFMLEAVPIDEGGPVDADAAFRELQPIIDSIEWQ